MADNREAIMFKKVPDGYVFRAPNPFVFGRARFYLVNEAQKAQLLAIITARNPAVFWVVVMFLIAAATAALAYGTGHDNPTVGDAIVMLGLIPVWLYSAVLISTRPTTRKLEPLLAGLQPTDQSITSADLRKAVRKTVSFGQHLTFGVSQAILSAALIVLILQKTNGGRVALLDDPKALLFAFNAFALAVSSIGFLIAALDKVRHRQDESDLSDRSFKAFLLPLFCLVISLGVLGFMVTNAWRTNQRNHETAQIQQRLNSLSARIDGSQTRGRAAKVSIAANSAHMSELITRLNNPAAKCDASATGDDTARAVSTESCRELIRKEQDAVRQELAATRVEKAVIERESAALQQENDAIRTELNAIKAMRR